MNISFYYLITNRVHPFCVDRSVIIEKQNLFCVEVFHEIFYLVYYLLWSASLSLSPETWYMTKATLQHASA